MKYIYNFTPRFSDFDMLQMVHHSVYLKYIEEARIEAFEHYFNSTISNFLSDICNIVVTNIDIKYINSLKIRKNYQIEVEFIFENNVYLNVKHRIFDDERTFAKGNMQLCFVDNNGKLLFEYPEFIRNTIQIYSSK